MGSDARRRQAPLCLREVGVMSLHINQPGNAPSPKWPMLTAHTSGYFVPLSFTPATLADHTGRYMDRSTYQPGCVPKRRGCRGCLLAPTGDGAIDWRPWALCPNPRHNGTGEWLLEKILAAGREQLTDRRSGRWKSSRTIRRPYASIEKAGFTVHRRLLAIIAAIPKGTHRQR